MRFDLTKTSYYSQYPELGLTEDKETSFIDINSLEELIAFVERYGPIIISHTGTEGNPFEIEIYDDYRE